MAIVGTINFNKKIKKNIFIIASAIYNGIWGLLDIKIFKVMFLYISNTPKDSLKMAFGEYVAPEANWMTNIFIGLCMVLIYFYGFMIPVNMYMREKSELKTKNYLEIVAVSTLAGILISLVL